MAALKHRKGDHRGQETEHREMDHNRLQILPSRRWRLCDSKVEKKIFCCQCTIDIDISNHTTQVSSLICIHLDFVRCHPDNERVICSVVLSMMQVCFLLTENGTEEEIDLLLCCSGVSL